MAKITIRKNIDDIWGKKIDINNTGIHEVGTLEDLKELGYPTFKIECLLQKVPVRQIVIKKTTLNLDAYDGQIYELPLNTIVYYEPWTFDRGSYLFEMVGSGRGKLCTEGDIVVIEKEESKRYPKPDYPYCNKGHNLVEVYSERTDAYIWDCPTCIAEMERIRQEE